MKVAIFAAGGLGKVICEALCMEGKHKIAGFFDDKKKGKFCGYPILGRCSEHKKICKKFKIEAVIIGFGYFYQSVRNLYYTKIFKNKDLLFVNAVHPTAVISPLANIGRGIYIGPQVVINPGTKIGDNTVIWAGTIIEHDNIIGKNVFITPGVRTAGYTEIGDNTFIGMGANIAGVKIESQVTVGAGSLVLDDVVRSKYIRGVPAKTIKKKNKSSYV